MRSSPAPFLVCSLLLLTSTACGQNAGSEAGENECAGAKCDTPGGESSDAHENCSLRQREALDSSTRAFSRQFVRWPCADVEGVNTAEFDDRGQEYCEYFAIFDPPGGSPVDLGRRRSNDRGDVTPHAICLSGESGSHCGASLGDDALASLEDEPSQVVGSCVFTSWHADVPGPLPSCSGGDCPSVHGFALDEAMFRMKLETNSNATASDVVQTCAELASKGLNVRQAFDPADPSDPFSDPFYRGCQMTAFFDLEWRRSDPAICAAVGRMVECGCSLPDVPLEQVGDRVVPPPPAEGAAVEFRGFGLGSFDGPDVLPAGCRYAPTGDDSRVIVLCDLLAADVLRNLGDPKHACRETYGGQIVAHAEIPADAITCTPPDTALAQGCGETPWDIGATP